MKLHDFLSILKMNIYFSIYVKLKKNYQVKMVNKIFFKLLSIKSQTTGKISGGFECCGKWGAYESKGIY